VRDVCAASARSCIDVGENEANVLPDTRANGQQRILLLPFLCLPGAFLRAAEEGGTENACAWVSDESLARTLGTSICINWLYLESGLPFLPLAFGLDSPVLMFSSPAPPLSRMGGSGWRPQGPRRPTKSTKEGFCGGKGAPNLPPARSSAATKLGDSTTSSASTHSLKALPQVIFSRSPVQRIGCKRLALVRKCNCGLTRKVIANFLLLSLRTRTFFPDQTYPEALNSLAQGGGGGGGGFIRIQ